MNIDNYNNLTLNVQNELNKYFINIPSCTYPKYNILYINENNIKIDIGLAGFDKNDLKVMYKDGELTILGNSNNNLNMNNNYNLNSRFLIKFLSTKNFVLYFYLKSNVRIINVNFVNGLLSILLELQTINNDINYIPITSTDIQKYNF